MTMFRPVATGISGSFAIIALCSMSAAALAEEFQQPRFSPQDTWIYHEKADRGGKVAEVDSEMSVVRSDADDLLVSVKPTGSSRAPREIMFKSDWARFRGVNGVETIVLRPFSFPLSIGKTWSVDYSEINPNPAHAKEEVSIPFRVTGWEDVVTPAGKFKALKIEAKGKWVADIAGRTQINSAVASSSGVAHVSRQDVVQGSRRAEGRLYHAFWYVPDVKRWVKSLDETFNSDGQVTESDESELTAFHFADPQKP